MNDISIRVSEDGSSTIYNKIVGENYHSIFGACTESMHVFINNGLLYKKTTSLKILEIGFGTGLNAFLTLIEGAKNNIDIIYEAIELYPLNSEIYQKLNYPEILDQTYSESFSDIHNCSWNKQIQISKSFVLKKIHADALSIDFGNDFDVIFFDAFSPEKQPEMWSKELFSKIYKSMKPDGILTTYCAKGMVKRNLRDAGFIIERLPGPPGKRHVLRAFRDRF